MTMGRENERADEGEGMGVNYERRQIKTITISKLRELSSDEYHKQIRSLFEEEMHVVLPYICNHSD